jgi:CubicO group peptidase (beta-lactamase class C family)
VVSGGELITAHVGFEDREEKIPAGDSTLYRWASVSKPMTAVVAMQLASQGKLDLDADVRTLVPEFPEKPWPVTARQLLCHQGGVVHYSNGVVVRTKREYDVPHPFADTILALDTFKDSPLVCEPGLKYSYTTHGYLLLGAAAERAAGVRFADLVRERVARPCGMATLRPDYQWEEIPNRAVGYRRGRDGEVVRSTNTDVSWKLAGGGWVSSAADMARFGAGMLDERLVDRATRESMWTRQKAREGSGGNYGLGFSIGKLDGKRLIAHSGSQEKTATYLAILPDAPGGGVVVAVLCNTEGTALRELAQDLCRLAAGTEPAAAGAGSDGAGSDGDPDPKE